jgi:hypothetical protein
VFFQVRNEEIQYTSRKTFQDSVEDKCPETVVQLPMRHKRSWGKKCSKTNSCRP